MPRRLSLKEALRYGVPIGEELETGPRLGNHPLDRRTLEESLQIAGELVLIFSEGVDDGGEEQGRQGRAIQTIAFTQVCTVVPLDTEIVLAAAEACRMHKLATADAIIFATARAHDVMLLTCDKHFKSLPAVTLLEKI